MATGRFAHIQVNREFSHKLPYPYSNCLDDASQSDSELVQSLLAAGYLYRQTDCYGMYICK